MAFDGGSNMGVFAGLGDHFLSLSDAAMLPLSFDADVAEIASWAASRASLEPPQMPRTMDESEHDDETVEFASVRTDSASESGSGGGGDALSPETDSRRRKRAKGHGKPAALSSDSLMDETKTRKPTYLVRKEEKDSLNDEIRLLEARLELLKLRAGIPTGEQKRTLASVQASNFEIEEAIHANLLGVARFHSMLARYLHSTPVNPIKTSIHLSKDVASRAATLRAMRDMKLRRAEEVANNRMRDADPTRPYSTEERYLSDDGTYHCKRFEITPFAGVGGARQVFDALLYYLSNMEMSITQQLGDLTIREDMNTVDPTTWNHRLVTATESGFMHELNTVGFSKFTEEYENKDGSGYGIVAADSVDADELYPYQPSERVRKDVTAAITVSEVEHPVTGETVVVLRRCVFLALHPAQFPVPTSVVEDMRTNIAQWCTVMNKSLRDALNPIQ